MLEAILVGIIDAVLLRKTMQFCSGVDTPGDRPASGNRIGHGGCGLAEIARIGFDNQILYEIR